MRTRCQTWASKVAHYTGNNRVKSKVQHPKSLDFGHCMIGLFRLILVNQQRVIRRFHPDGTVIQFVAIKEDLNQGSLSQMTLNQRFR
jgi:hypothetical protein